MSEDINNNFNFNADEEFVKIILSLVVGAICLVITWKTGTNDTVNIVLTALISYLVGSNLIKKNTNQ